MGEYRKLQPKKFEPRSIRETAEGRYWRAYKSPALLDQISQVTSVAFADVYPYALAVTSSARVTVTVRSLPTRLWAALYALLRSVTGGW